MDDTGTKDQQGALTVALAIVVDEWTASLLEERTQGEETPAEAAARILMGRLRATARDESKERAIKNGAKGVRRRYQPRHAAPEIAIPETPKEVKTWAADAPTATATRRIETK